MGFFNKVRERKEVFMKIRASNIDKRKKKRSERVEQMKKENKLYRAEAKAQKEYKDLKRERFRHKTAGLRRVGEGLKKLGGATESTSPFSPNNKKKKGANGKGIFY